MLKNLLYFGVGAFFLALASGVGSLDSMIVNVSELPRNSQILMSWALFVIFSYFTLKGGIEG